MTIDPRVHVSLRLLGDFDPDVATTRLCLNPSHTHLRGALAGNGRTGRRYQHSLWLMGSEEHVHSLNFEPHVTWLLDQIEPHAEALAGLKAEGVECDVDCFWESTWMSGGPWISPESMARLSTLNLPLVISFYLADEGDGEDRFSS